MPDAVLSTLYKELSLNSTLRAKAVAANNFPLAHERELDDLTLTNAIKYFKRKQHES